jgi:hypothetical protein
MFFVAGILVVLAGLFYAAGNHEIGTLGVEMCRYGDTFCDHPLGGAGLAAIWGAFREHGLKAEKVGRKQRPN